MAASKKLSTLIIDAVVDTKGIDRAVGSINSKLRGVGGTAGGVGGGGQFRAGMTPFGLQFGSDAATTAAAAAIGAGAAAKFAASPSGWKEANVDGVNVRIPSNNPQNAAAAAFDRMHTFFVSRMARSTVRGAAYNPKTTFFTPGPNEELGMLYLERENRKRWNRQQFVNRKGAQFAQAGVRFMNRFSSTDEGGGLAALSPFARTLAGGLGIGSAAIAINYLNNYDQRMQGMFSNRAQFRGTPMAELAAGLRRDYPSGGQARATFGQGFFLGGRYGSGGQMSTAESIFGGGQGFFGNLGFNAGFMLSDIGDYAYQSMYPGSPLRQQLAGETKQNMSGTQRTIKAFYDWLFNDNLQYY